MVDLIALMVGMSLFSVPEPRGKGRPECTAQ